MAKDKGTTSGRVGTPDGTPPAASPASGPDENNQATQPFSTPPPPPGPTQGEVDELRDDNLNLQAENAQLKAQQEAMMQRLERMERLLSGRPAAQPHPLDEPDPAIETPIFDETEPHGLIYGDANAAFVQNGHQFGRNREYLGTEKHRGSPRPFKPQLVGIVRKPKLVEAA